MNSTFEEIVCAIAVKNGFITRDEALESLDAYRALPEGPARPSIGQVMVDRGTITGAQSALLEQGAKRLMAGGTARLTAAAPAPAPAAAAPPINPQEPIPGYRILGKLGAGGTATVFDAEDRKGKRRVALKILQPARAKDAKALASFRREAELLVKFDHPNLVKGYDQGQSGPLAFVAMELLEGESVQQVIERDKQLPEARALEIILDTAKALEYIQQQGIVHRDIKPGNIMVLKTGAVKLCDLGFATPIDGSGAPDGETTSGTVQYMAPEQARGQADLDIRADIYALGASLYHMVMGEVPFQGGDSVEVMAKQVLEALNSTEIKNRRVSKHMHYFIERMMSKDKALRYATPRELIEDINAQIDGFKSLEYKPEVPERRPGTGLHRRPGSPPTTPGGPRQTTTRFRNISEWRKKHPGQ